MHDGKGRDDQLAERFARVPVAAVVDIVEKRGGPNVCLPSAIAALTPQTVVVGPAFPYTYVPSESREREIVHEKTLAAYQSAPYGSVFVCAPTPSEHAESGNFGELGHAMNAGNGIRGFVIDGGVRDSTYLAQSGLGVFCRYRHPRPLLGRWQIGHYGDAITIADVTIRTADWIVGDWDGVICVPREIVDEVLEEAEQHAATERQWRQSVDGAVDPVGTYLELERQYERSGS
jgi:4-hydroxy-4-methyl-2-oxoglutarate aldolase